MEINATATIEIGGIPIGPGLTEEQAKTIFALGREAVVFVIMAQAKMIARQKADAFDSPAAPSSATPPYKKQNKSSRRRKRVRRKGGGTHRETVDRIDRCEEHRAAACPDCGNRNLSRRKRTRTRIIIDIPENAQAEVVEHTLHRDGCPQCQKDVEPIVPDALPKCTLGHRMVSFTAWLHYGLGVTLSQIVETFNYHLQTTISEGGLVEMWHRSADIFEPWYEQIKRDALNSAVLHGDETGWRVNGKTHWLWCFSSTDATYYMIARSRGSPALNEFFQEFFDGVLVTDFWAAYNAVCCADRQMCLVSATGGLGELKKVAAYKESGGDWTAFSKKLKRLVRNAIRLWKQREDYDPVTYHSRRQRIDVRLRQLIADEWDNPEARRLIKRLDKYQDYLFTFLDKPYVPFDNNHAERAIRPAVILRKNSYANRSVKGAATQSILMSILRTLKQRSRNPIATLTEALREYVLTETLPPLPPNNVADE